MSDDSSAVIGEHDWLDPVEMMLRSVARRLLVAGVMGLIVGLALVGAPGLSSIGLSRLIGGYLLVSGAAQFFFTVRDREDLQRWQAQTAFAVLTFAAGVVLLSLPDVSIRTVALLLGVTFVTVGSGELVTSAMLRSLLPGWRLLGTTGALSVVTGVAVFVWPDATIRVLAVLSGTQLVLVATALLAVRHRVVAMLERLERGRPESDTSKHVIDLREPMAPLRRMTAEWDISWQDESEGSARSN